MCFDTHVFVSLSVNFLPVCTETAGEVDIGPFTIVSKVARLRGFFLPVQFLHGCGEKTTPFRSIHPTETLDFYGQTTFDPTSLTMDKQTFVTNAVVITVVL